MYLENEGPGVAENMNRGKETAIALSLLCFAIFVSLNDVQRKVYMLLEKR